MFGILWNVYGAQTIPLAIFLTFPENSGCLEGLFSWWFGAFFMRLFPVWLMTLAPDVECGKFCWYLYYCWHSSACSETADCTPGAAGELSLCPDREASPTALSLGAAWRNALLHAEQAKAGGYQTQGFRGRLLHVMHNSWPLWTFQLRPLGLMGNPNGDLFIKTISWLFVVPASYKGANSCFNIITLSFRLPAPELHFGHTTVCQFMRSIIHTYH